MSFRLPPLPYDKNALAPHMSAETLEYHYGRHHQGYVDALNKLIEGKPEEDKDLESIIMSSEGPVFNNAAQVWNHSFFWKCMRANGGGQPSGELAGKIAESFGAYENFAYELSEAAASQFGSGWAWLVRDQGKLAIRKTANADLPLKHGETALLTIDVWEHAYYLDHKNLRPEYIQTFLGHLVNWQFVAENLARSQASNAPKVPPENSSHGNDKRE